MVENAESGSTLQALSADDRATAAGLPVLDFDIELDPQFREDPTVKWHEAATAGPIFYSSAARGFWVITEYDLIREIVQQPEQFSSREIYLFYRRSLGFFDIPTQLDRPEHTPIRRLVHPLLSPGAVRELEPFIRSTTRRLIDEIARNSRCEFNSAFALRLPAIVVMAQLGLPPEREHELVDLALRVAHPDSATDPGLHKHAEAARELDEMWLGVIVDRRVNPRDDWTSQLVHARIDGKALDDKTLLGLMGTLLRGGFDTTAGTLGYTFAFLASHPDRRNELIRNPDSVPTAVEEFLRWYGGVPLITRTVTTDLEFHGVQMRQGDRLVLLLWSANHDSKAFDAPHEVDLCREPNKHLAFGLGPHRCAGMHLARAEIRVTLEEWHARIPDYHLGDMSGVEHEVSQNIRLSQLPLIIDRVV